MTKVRKKSWGMTKGRKKSWGMTKGRKKSWGITKGRKKSWGMTMGRKKSRGKNKDRKRSWGIAKGRKKSWGIKEVAEPHGKEEGRTVPIMTAARQERDASTKVPKKIIIRKSWCYYSCNVTMETTDKKRASWKQAGEARECIGKMAYTGRLKRCNLNQSESRAV